MLLDICGRNICCCGCGGEFLTLCCKVFSLCTGSYPLLIPIPQASTTFYPLQLWQINIPKQGLPWWLSGKESACQCRRHGFNPSSRKIPHATEQLSPCSTTTEPVPTTSESVHSRARALQQDKQLQWEARVPQLGSSPHSLQPEKSSCCNQDPAQP